MRLQLRVVGGKAVGSDAWARQLVSLPVRLNSRASDCARLLTGIYMAVRRGTCNARDAHRVNYDIGFTEDYRQPKKEPRERVMNMQPGIAMTFGILYSRLSDPGGRQRMTRPQESQQRTRASGE